MKYNVIYSGVVIMGLVAGALTCTCAIAQTEQAEPMGIAQSLPLTTMIVHSAHGKKHSFHVQTAKTFEQQEIGLMWRQSMPDTEGMYFPFDTEREAAFWMKNCFMPIDMLFIKKDGRIANIITAPPMTLEPRKSNGVVMAVLELGGGVAAKQGIKPGDRVLAVDGHTHR